MLSSALSAPIDVLSPAFARDPYPTYARLREGPPVRPSPLGGWLVTRYEDVRAGLKDHRLRSIDIPAAVRAKHRSIGGLGLREPGATLRDLMNNVSNWLAFVEPPHHARLKATIGGNMKKSYVDGLRPYIQARVGELLNKAVSKGKMDFIHDFVHELPAHVIARLLGLPPEDVPKFDRWMRTMLVVFDPSLPLSAYYAANAAAVEVQAHLSGLIEQRRRYPTNDYVSLMVDASDGNVPFTDEEVASTCISLFTAGVETSTSLLGMGLLALLKNEAQKNLLVRDPTLIGSAVEELLRFEPSVQFASRMAHEDFEWHGTRIRAGQMVHMYVAAANRDAAKFSSADTLDIRRTPNPHLTFGAGHHFCVGAPLARLMAQTALEVLFTTLPNIRLTDEPPTYAPNPIVRELKALPLAF